MVAHQGGKLGLYDSRGLRYRTLVRPLRQHGKGKVLTLLDLGKSLVLAFIGALSFAKGRYAATRAGKKSEGGYIKAGSGKHIIENPVYLVLPAYTKT
ncbi:hypothetical protein GCM10011342_10230 [Aquisalinus flavus]|uniref:Uncharacterized protein n=1 Tax=Aquisalinus flavus TaxID=1526572 RepID=A0A8J2Y5Y6_9PROT|nr:hypothetical protein GCM10011342_10230 [Aquisalinus flavus]